ncbi:MAG: hypothetical protein M1503_08855 [Thaumarchaeota archaeon]|nr:hypothetical protein [Nitrososphaerota archaeon]MCL5318347.1 hypothetical protein [Nitrososphaerota archaeon]
MEPNTNPNDPNKDKKNEWTPQNLKEFVEAVIPLAEKYIQYKKDESEATARRLSAVGVHNRRLSYSLLLFMIGLVGLMTYLTWVGKVSGDALLFLAGTITGYVILMIQKLVFPLIEEPEAADDS